MCWKRITVEDRERALVAKNGRLRTILTPGDYRISVADGSSLSIEKHTVSDLVFQSVWSDHLVSFHPDLTESHFCRVETNETQVALVYVDDALHTILTPAKRVLFWRGVANITAEFVEMIGDVRGPAKKQKACGSGVAKQSSVERRSKEKSLASGVKLLA